MSFQAKRIRVQLPCRETSMIEPEPVDQQMPVAAPDIGAAFECPWQSEPCLFGTCVEDSFPDLDRGGAIVIDAAQLPILRARLEAQLKEVEEAERMVKERGQQ